MATLHINSDGKLLHPVLLNHNNKAADCDSLLLTNTVEEDTAPAQSSTRIKYNSSDFESVTVLLGAGDSQQSITGERGNGDDEFDSGVLIPLSLKAGEVSKDVVFTLLVVLKGAGTQGDGEKDWTHKDGTWTLDPYVRIKRKSYKLSS